jgi:uracil-DNA glycosylase family 4
VAGCPMKQREYQVLVEKRKACSLCKGQLENASRIEGGVHDSDRVGPYSRWQGNLDASVVVVAQDFSDVAGFCKYRGWAGSDVQTNKYLVELLGCADFAVALPEYGKPDDKLFFTNAVLCMKSGQQGGRQQSVSVSCFNNCSSFLKTTIEIIAPRLVITLGEQALRATTHAFGIRKAEPLSRCVGHPVALASGIQLVPVYHPSPTVVNTHRCIERMRADWRGIGQLLKQNA